MSAAISWLLLGATRLLRRRCAPPRNDTLLTAVLLLSISTTAQASPQRIISLKPNITEIVFALGAADRVVGVTRWCNYPPAVAALPKVGDYLRPQVERILALRPDLVLAARENSDARPIQQLERAGIPVMLVDVDSLPSLYTAIDTIGRRVGRRAAARRLVAELRRTMTPPTATVPPPTRTLILVGHHPFIAAGPQSFVGELLVLAGGDNVIRASHPAYPQLSLEQILAAQPQLIVEVRESTDRDPAWAKDLGARAARINIDLFRPGPRIGLGLQALRRALTTESHP